MKITDIIRSICAGAFWGLLLLVAYYTIFSLTP